LPVDRDPVRAISRVRDKAALSAEVLQTTRMTSVRNRRLAAPRKPI